MTNSKSKTERTALQLIWATIRPRQWIKSSFLFAPALFTLKIIDLTILPELLLGAFGFSLIASSIYTFNDIINRHEDRIHPIKRLRPIAAGEMSISYAGILSVLLLLFGSGLLYLSGSSVLMIGLVYVLLMIAYTLYFRKVLIIDVIIIGIGFVLRVLAGSLLISSPASHWLLLCTFTIALFLGMIKRRHEVMAFQEFTANDSETVNPTAREVLSRYPEISVINGWINILAGMTVLCYALYAVDPVTAAKHHTGSLIYTLPFVLYGVFRYQQLSMVNHAGEDPTKLVTNDLGIKVIVALWAVTVGVILFFAKGGG